MSTILPSASSSKAGVLSTGTQTVAGDKTFSGNVTFSGSVFGITASATTAAITVTQSSHGFALGEALYYTGSVYAKAMADVAATAEVVGVVSNVVDANNFQLAFEGRVSGLSGLTAGAVYFLSASTPGAITATEPTTVGYVSLPMGIAVSTTVLLIRSSRGAVVGATNARTEIALANNATTNVQSVTAYQAGELTGYVDIDGTTDLKFYVSAPFAKNGAATDWNISPQYVGDTPPVGFSLSITTGGLIQVTMPSITGYASAKINYALNAPAVGATFPLAIDSTNVQFSTLKAKDSGGFIFQENGGTQIGSWSDSGGLVVGPSGSGNLLHTINGVATFQSSQTGASAVWKFNNAGASPAASRIELSTIGTTTSSAVYHRFLRGAAGTTMEWDVGVVGSVNSAYSWSSAVAEVGWITQAGGWTFGNSSSGIGHVFYSGGAAGGYVDASSTAALNNDAQVGFRVATSGAGQRAALSASRSTASGAPGVGLLEMVATDTNNYYLWVNAGTWYTGSTYANIGGTTGTVVGSQTSDERLKSNIHPTPYGLETVLRLEPINFVMDGKSKVGFSAQRTRPVIPEAVFSTGDAIKEGEESKLAMEYAQIVPVLVKAIQELSAKVAALESQLN